MILNVIVQKYNILNCMYGYPGVFVNILSTCTRSSTSTGKGWRSEIGDLPGTSYQVQVLTVVLVLENHAVWVLGSAEMSTQ
jgi:hypothetical protein